MIFALLVCSGSLATSLPVQVASAQDLAAYETARENVGRSPEAHVELALWCEAHGLKAEQLKHLAIAVLMDPKSASARGLMGLVAYHGRWQRPDAVAEKVKADEALTAKLAEYNARRGRLRETADANWDLAVWCERNALDAEAKAHFTVVTQLDPSRESAWKRLGCKRVGGRWVSEAQLAAEKDEAKEQEKADRHWKPLLTKWRGWLGDKARRAEAEEALATVTDPRAASAVWSVLVAGSTPHHAQAVQVLGQIDAQAASRALATLAVFDNSAEVRRLATETLRGRDPREFAGLLVGLLRKPVKYEVRPVGGPGSPGALFVEGKQFNVQRTYAPPAMPAFPITPNDRIAYDDNGLPVIVRTTQSSHPNVIAGIPNVFMSLSQFDQFNPTDPGLAAAVADFRAHAPAEWAKFFKGRSNNSWLMHTNPAAELSHLGVHFSPSIGTTTTTVQQQFAVGQMVLEYRKAALIAQQQLARDVARVEAYKNEVQQSNERVARVLVDISGQDRGEDPESWRAWWVDQKGYAYTPTPEAPRPTIVEDVPLGYSPQPVPVTTNISTSSGGTTKITPYSTLPSCFGAGTLVRTLDGSRAIETLNVGDLVLTQDIKTGALDYHPVMVIHHNPPSPTFLIKVGGDTIVSSPFHRFWIVGKGWVMARDLRGGENLRLLDGPARVESVESGAVQLVYNLDVAGAHDFFAGASGALVHDNTLPDTRLAPFDAARDIAAITSAQ